MVTVKSCEETHTGYGKKHFQHISQPAFDIQDLLQLQVRSWLQSHTVLHLFPPASPVSQPLLTVLPPVTHFWAPVFRKTYCKLSIHLIIVQENQRKAVHSSLKEVVPRRAAQEVLNHHQSRYRATKAAEHI